MKRICYYSIIIHNTPTVWRNARKQRKERKDKYILVHTHTHTKMFLYNNQTSTSLRKPINTISASKFHFVYVSSQKKSNAAHERRNSPVSSTARLILRAGGGGERGVGRGERPQGVGEREECKQAMLCSAGDTTCLSKSIQDKESVRSKMQNPARPVALK